MLRAVLAHPGPIRVMLVARALGEWWDRLIEKSAPAIGALLTQAEPIRLAEQMAPHRGRGRAARGRSIA